MTPKHASQPWFRVQPENNDRVFVLLQPETLNLAPECP